MCSSNCFTLVIWDLRTSIMGWMEHTADEKLPGAEAPPLPYVTCQRSHHVETSRCLIVVLYSCIVKWRTTPGR